MSGSPLHQLSALGQSVWIDSLSRDALRSGELARMLEEDAVVGVTSNPTIFQKAMAAGEAYDEQLRDVLTREQDPKEIFLELSRSDIVEACDLLRPIWDATNDLGGVISVASFFVSRIDTEVDRRLEELGNTELQGRLAIDNAKLAYQAYKRIFSPDSERWQRLQAAGARPQRCLWASTSTKNPDYRDVLYVEELIGPDTVNTMPGETIRAFQDHGEVRGDTVLEGVDEAQRLFEQLAEAGVDYDDVSETLEKEGVEKFADSFEELKSGIMGKLGALQTA